MRASLLVLLVAACSSKQSLPVDAPGFTCGSATCSIATQFCMKFLGGVGPATAVAGCNDVPGACQPTITCDCLVAMTTTSCGSAVVACSGGAQEGFTLTCPNP